MHAEVVHLLSVYMAILLIGSTGNGKSSLGNFLINPDDDHLCKHQIFATAKSNLPETQRVQVEESHIKLPGNAGDFQFKIIDTPGLNEMNSDFQHMIDILETIKEEKSIKACILVVKFDSKIDAQYVSTVTYYSKLLPFLFERNVIIVMTDFAADERSVMMRERRGIDVDEEKSRAVDTIVKSGCLNYKPIVFTIDSLPAEDEDEREVNLGERLAILQCINYSMTPVNSESVKVAKTDDLKQKDREIIGKCEGQISGYNERLQQTQGKHSEKLKEIERIENKITYNTSYLKTTKEALDQKDSEALVVVGTWNFSKTWKMFRKTEEEFDITVPYLDVKVSKWDNGNCTWEKFSARRTEGDTGTRVTGKLS